MDLAITAVFEGSSWVVEHFPATLRSAGVCLLFFTFWCLNLYVFDRLDIPYRSALGLKKNDADYSLNSKALKQIWLWFGICLVLYEACRLTEHERASHIVSLLFWLVLALMIMASKAKFYLAMRNTITDFVGVLVFFREVRFSHVLLGDALTSLSVVLSESAAIGCTLVALLYPDAVTTIDCRPTLLSPALQALPYLIRAWHCFIVIRTTGNKPQIINLIKYLSIFPVIVFSALKPITIQTVLDQTDRTLFDWWLYSVIFNTMLSVCWDVFMDWGLGWPHPENVYSPFFLRPTLLFRSPLYYYVSIMMNIALRLCWSLRLSVHLQRQASGPAFAFIFEVLEVFRRFVWNFFRVEWECVKERHYLLVDDHRSPSRDAIASIKTIDEHGL